MRASTCIRTDLANLIVLSAHLPSMEKRDLCSLVFGFKNKKYPGFDAIRIDDIRPNFDTPGNIWGLFSSP